MKIGAVIFDFDGVLIRSYDDHLRAFLHTAKKYGYRIDRVEVYKRFGMSAKEIVEELLPTLPDREIERFIKEKEIAYRKILRGKKIKLVGGAEALLELLKKRKIPVAISSSASEANIRLALKRSILKKYFRVIVAAEHVRRHKPYPDALLKAARFLRIEPKNCLYIGDSIYEMVAARRAGMTGIGMLTGFYTKGALLKAGAKAVFKDMAEVRKFITKNL